MSLFRTLLKPQNPHQPLSFSSIFLRPLTSLEPTISTKPTKPLSLVFKEAVGLSPKPESSSDTETNDDPLKQSLRELEQELKTHPNAAQIKSKAGRNKPENPKSRISLYAVYTNKTAEGETGKKVIRESSEVCKELSPEMKMVVSYLYKEGYFSNATFSSLFKDKLDFDCFNNRYSRGYIKYAAEKFGKDKQEIVKWLSGSDLKKVALLGCPSLVKNSVFAAKRLRKFFEIPEETVCSKCVLRESCKFVNRSVWAPTKTTNVGRGNPKNLYLADVMLTITSYALESVPPQLVVTEDIKTSVGRLLKEILKMSQTTTGGTLDCSETAGLQD